MNKQGEIARMYNKMEMGNNFREKTWENMNGKNIKI